MRKKIIFEMKNKMLQERFGDPIGSKYAGDAPAGARDEGSVCEDCGMLEIEGDCGCIHM